MQKVVDYFTENPIPRQILELLISIIVAYIIVRILFRLESKIVSRIPRKKKNLNNRLLENGFKFVIVFLAVQWVMMSSDLTRSFGQVLFQGTAVLAAIAAFAAQNVLADMLCGLMISTTKPFEIGDRISTDSGISGIIKDITLRHVIVQGLDTQVYIIPNSKVNSQTITNLSWHTETRSVDFRFNVSYEADPDKARQVIRQAIMESSHSVPKDQGDYADVYFLSMDTYSLTMGTTAYYKPVIPTEVFKTDINTRVKKALESNGIEIPYPYINVIARN